LCRRSQENIKIAHPVWRDTRAASGFFGIFSGSRKITRTDDLGFAFGFMDLAVPDGRIKRPNRCYRSRLIVL
jgi:hypothetical protein